MVSLLLRYPDEAFMRDLGAMSQCLGQQPEGGPEAILKAFIHQVRETPLIEVQETYTRTFDLNPGTSLDASCHQWGEEERRMQALSNLNRIYRDSGFEPGGGQLPDHLPMILEFLTVCSDQTFCLLSKEYRHSVSTLKTRLQGLGSPYADLMAAAEEAMFP